MKAGTTGTRAPYGAGLLMALSLGALLIAGCSKPQEATDAPAPSAQGGQQPRTGGGGPDGREPGGGRGRGGPVADNASGAEIYQAKCGCHGPDGKGGRAPVLTALASRPDADLYKTIHDGHGKMPAFGTQLKEAQINKVVTYLKRLTPG